MSKHQLTDTEVDRRAMAYANQNLVSYGEALTAVVSFAQVERAQTAAQPTKPSNSSSLTDQELHDQALIFAQKSGLDYAAALRAVVSGQKTLSQNTVAQRNYSPDGDQRIHEAALRQASASGMNYSEALTHVTSSFSTTNFSESDNSSHADAAVQALQGQPIEIFKAGTHIDNQGRSRVFTVADVQAMAENYAPASHEAPLTVGHPGDNLPAYGWAKALQATSDGRLLMTAYKVEPAFASAVKDGRYAKRSASFYPPDAPQNPKPGQWYLRHVGWLGAQPPAVRGLADVKFSLSKDSISVSFDLA